MSSDQIIRSREAELLEMILNQLHGIHSQQREVKEMLVMGLKDIDDALGAIENAIKNFGADLTLVLTDLVNKIQTGGDTSSEVARAKAIADKLVGFDTQTVAADPGAIPAPLSLTSLSPTSAKAGDPDTTLTVNGTGFVSAAAGASAVSFNGSPRLTSFVSGTQLTAVIGASDLVEGVASITVVNPDGTVSNSLSFTIAPAA